MPRGGARNRSGPQPDETSGRSEARGVVFTALPAGGYRGEVPEYPLPDVSERELVVWEQAWRTPQAAAWSAQPWRWRTVAMWARWSVRMEDPDAGAALGNVVVRLADQVGLTPAGLRENGWKIAERAPEPVRDPAPATKATPRRSPRDRLKVVSGGAAD